MSLPQTQQAVALPAKRTPFTSITVPVVAPSAGEVVIKVLWTSSTPLDLHRADGGLLISEYPQRMGNGGAAGTVVATGDGDNNDLKGLRVGDDVMSFAFHGGQEANHQEYITVPAYLVSKVPRGLSLQEAVTVPVNLVTVFHAATADLDLELPWPIPQGWTPRDSRRPILVWGAASSVGIFALQVLRHWGYGNVLAVASGKHHDYLKSIGASETFDYRRDDVVDKILAYTENNDSGVPPAVPYILDCIGSVDGTLKPLTKIAQSGSKVAVMLPVIIKDATDEEEPEYEMDATKVLVDQWARGVIVRGVRTHFYLQNEFFKEKLQSEIVPALLQQGIVKPNKQRIVEGATAVERAQNALDLLRRREVSGERLVWRVAEA